MNALEWDLEPLLRPLTYITQSKQRIFWLYLVIAILLAFGVYRDQRSSAKSSAAPLPDDLSNDHSSERGSPETKLSNEPERPRSFWSFLFPASIYKHPAMLTDATYFFINQLCYAWLVLPFLLSSGVIAEWTAQTLFNGFGEAGWYLEQGPALDLCLTFFLIVATDLGIFLSHVLQHKVPLLWEFHKVHHSAEIMTPITVYRMHPIDDIFAVSVSGLLTGLVLGTFSYLFDNPLTVVTVLRLNLFVFGFYIIGYNLRHSHVWLDYGPRLKKVLVSPAQHQIHHSSDPRHFDKNFGFMFSFWDRMLGSLYVPETREQLTFGLGGSEHGDYRGLLRLYFLPFKKSAQLMAKFADQSPLKKGLVFLCLLLGLGYVVYDSLVTEPPKAPVQKVHLEQLTWTETQSLVKKGFRSIIVPTGGTEQNGPHMVLGKHNYIVRYTSEQIARTIGQTLVAPVITHVPEGKTSPPTEHMKFAGTISVSVEVFSQLLEETARSLKVHGFQTIYFVGDSYWNQEPQQKVAEKLNKEWAKENVRVYHLGDYYKRNGQIEWLQSKGETDGNIGGHAGIRDTSELMIVYPEGLRPDQFERHGGSEYSVSGVHGDPRRASKQRGRKLLQMKVYAACRQIRDLQKSRNQGSH